MKKENLLAINDATHNARSMHHNFSALQKILLYDGTPDERIEMSMYIQRRDKAKSPVTKAKWYYKLITTFHAASAILHNGQHFYKCMVTNVDMDDLKNYLRERAKELLTEKPSVSSWAARVRAATLESLDLDEMI